MNALAIGAVGGIALLCYLIIANFLVKMATIALAGHPAGEGLAAIFA